MKPTPRETYFDPYERIVRELVIHVPGPRTAIAIQFNNIHVRIAIFFYHEFYYVYFSLFRNFSIPPLHLDTNVFNPVRFRQRRRYKFQSIIISYYIYIISLLVYYTYLRRVQIRSSFFRVHDLSLTRILFSYNIRVHKFKKKKKTKFWNIIYIYLYNFVAHVQRYSKV